MPGCTFFLYHRLHTAGARRLSCFVLFETIIKYLRIQNSFAAGNSWLYDMTTYQGGKMMVGFFVSFLAFDSAGRLLLKEEKREKKGL